jgi:hypothetical protein
MAKTKISEYDSSAANNTDVDGINIAESCPPSGINNAIREVMAHLKDFQTGTSGDSLTNTSTITSSGTLAVTGNLTLDGASGTSGQVLVSAGSGSTPTWGNAFVAGMIMMWSGTIATIPSGWYLCDGTNSTPDLRNKFIIGANADDAGAAKTNVTGSATQSGGSKDAIVVSHTHTGSTDSAGAHTHVIGSDSTSGGVDLGGWSGPYMMASGSKCCSWTSATQSAGAHTHTITMDSTGSSGTNANLPPYYALAFIMKG